MAECCQCDQDSEKIVELVSEARRAVETLRKMAGDVAHGLSPSVGDLRGTAHALEYEVDRVSPPPEELEPYDREKCWHTHVPFRATGRA